MALELMRIVADTVSRHVANERERNAVQREFARLTTGWPSEGDVLDAEPANTDAA